MALTFFNVYFKHLFEELVLFKTLIRGINQKLLHNPELAALAAGAFPFHRETVLPSLYSDCNTLGTLPLLANVLGPASYRNQLTSLSRDILLEITRDDRACRSRIGRNRPLYIEPLKHVLHTICHFASQPAKWDFIAVSRSQRDYENGARFGHLSHSAMVRILDWLIEPSTGAQLIESRRGSFDRSILSGVTTRVWPTRPLLDRLTQHGLIWSGHPYRAKANTNWPLVVIKLNDKTYIPVQRPLTDKEACLVSINRRLASTKIELPITAYSDYETLWDYRERKFRAQPHYRQLRRQFSEQEGRGGRLYGHFVQTIPRELRPSLLIAGSPTAELDYRAAQVAFAYSMLNETCPAGDPYTIPGFEQWDRSVFKACFTTAVGSDDPKQLVSAFAHNVGRVPIRGVADRWSSTDFR